MTDLPNTRAALERLARRQANIKAQKLRTEIIRELSHAGTGRTYKSTHRYVKRDDALVRRRRTKSHTASAAGKPPAVDTGRLRQSINVQKVAEGHYRVGTNVPYALSLEFGTRKMAARPFMRPALERVRNG